MPSEPQYRTVDKFDRIMGSMVNRPDVTHTKATTTTVVQPLIGEAQTFVVQTYRERERGDTIFIQYAASEGLVRIAIPPTVADTIARQRDALATKVRKKLGRQQAAERAARGELPAFMRNRTGPPAN